MSVPPAGLAAAGAGELAEKVVLVTASSSGIGRQIAIGLARAGADVAVNHFRNPAGGEEAAAAIAALGRHTANLPADCTRPEECTALVAATVERLGALDILVNNCGVYAFKPAREHTPEEFAAIIAGTAGATFHCSMAALPHMRAKGWGRIVNVAAAGAERAAGFPRMGPHMAGKAAVVSLTRTLAQEEGGFGVTVNAVSPGIINLRETPRAEAERMSDGTNPTGRPGVGEDIVDAVLYLVSPRASFVNGAVITVSGGWMA